MFPWSSAKQFAQRAAVAVGTARALLLLEDDSSVDWEVDGDARRPIAHPHRRQLRGRFADRRAGQPAPAALACLTPLGAAPVAAQQARGAQRQRALSRSRCSGGAAQDATR
jgi:hypothetical protein